MRIRLAKKIVKNRSRYSMGRITAAYLRLGIRFIRCEWKVEVAVARHTPAEWHTEVVDALALQNGFVRSP